MSKPFWIISSLPIFVKPLSRLFNLSSFIISKTIDFTSSELHLGVSSTHDINVKLIIGIKNKFLMSVFYEKPTLNYENLCVKMWDNLQQQAIRISNTLLL